MDLEFRQLRDFLTVIEFGSLGDAARQLKTSQPTLTRSVKLIEKAVGGAVFDRMPHGMRPTGLGRALERRARLIMGEVSSAQRELDDLVEARRGSIVIGTGPLSAALILPRAVARFRAEHPHVDITVLQNHFPDTLSRVRSGEIDFTFHSAPQTMDPDLVHRVLVRGMKTVIITRSDNPLVSRPRVSLQELAIAPWVLAHKSAYLRQRVEAAFRRARMTPPNPVIEYGSIFEALDFMREARDLVTLLFDGLFRSRKELDNFKALTVPEMTWPVTTGVIYRRDRPLQPAAARFLEEVRAVCDERSKR